MLPLISAMLIPLPTLFFTLLISLEQTREDNQATLPLFKKRNFRAESLKGGIKNDNENSNIKAFYTYLYTEIHQNNLQNAFKTIECSNVCRKPTSCFCKAGGVQFYKFY